MGAAPVYEHQPEAQAALGGIGRGVLLFYLNGRVCWSKVEGRGYERERIKRKGKWKKMDGKEDR